MSKHCRGFNLLIRLFLTLAAVLACHSPAIPPRLGGARVQAGTIINVTTQTDELNNDGDCSLREAIRAANTNAAVDACPAGTGFDTVAIPPGTYNLTVSGAGEDEGTSGDLDIFDDLIVVGASLASTILDGQASDRIFQVTTEVEVKFINLTLRNGFAVGSVYGGGGILNGSPDALPGTIQVINCVFTQNNAENTGGGLENVGTASLTNVSFIDNQSAVGGGIFSDGTLIMQGVTLHGNTASGTGGGHGQPHRCDAAECHLQQ